MENSIADDFVSYDCFMQPFDSPDEGDEQTKGLEIEYFYQIDKNNSDHKVDTCCCFFLVAIYRNIC